MPALDDFDLVDAHCQPDHVLMWPGRMIAVFKCPPMTYIVVYGDDAKPFAWPKSLDEDTVTALGQRFFDRLKKPT